MNNGWLAGNWWQLLSALVLFTSYSAVMAKAVHTIKTMETRVKELEDKLDQHMLSSALHRSPDFEHRMGDIESGLRTVTSILVQIQTDLGILLKHNS